MKGQKTTAEIVSIYKVHPSQVNQWKKRLEEDVSELFCSEQDKKKANPTNESTLFEEIGRLKFELDRLKKIGLRTLAERRGMVDSETRALPLAEQCR